MIEIERVNELMMCMCFEGCNEETCPVSEENTDAYKTNNECQFAIAMQMVDKAIKYRWHDLRKNPDDLPKSETRVIFYTTELEDVNNEHMYIV